VVLQRFLKLAAPCTSSSLTDKIGTWVVSGQGPQEVQTKSSDYLESGGNTSGRFLEKVSLSLVGWMGWLGRNGILRKRTGGRVRRQGCVSTTHRVSKFL
jgi:hypothetical protein